MVNRAAAAKAKRDRLAAAAAEQLTDSPSGVSVDIAGEQQVTEPKPAAPPADNGKKASKTRSTSTGTSTGTSSREKSAETTATDPRAAEAVLDEARARAEAERAEAAKAVGLDNSSSPKLTKAQRQQLRRLELRHIAVEVTILHGAKLDKLSAHHGTQRAAVEAAIDQAYAQLEAD